jgi:hypothetical protein
MNIIFDRSDVKDRNNIHIHARFPEEDTFEVESGITGAKKTFHFDRDKTSFECEMAEGWDGEEDHSWYLSDCGTITLEIWNSRNCETPLF